MSEEQSPLAVNLGLPAASPGGPAHLQTGGRCPRWLAGGAEDLCTSALSLLGSTLHPQLLPLSPDPAELMVSLGGDVAGVGLRGEHGAGAQAFLLLACGIGVRTSRTV